MINRYFCRILAIPILFIMLLSCVIIYIFVSMSTSILENYKSSQKEEYFENEKYISSIRVDDIAKYIEQLKKIFPNDIKKQKALATQYIKDNQDLKRYIFVLSDVNLKGGDKFAKMYINPNRKDLIGKYLNDSYKDKMSKEFRKEILEKMRKNGKGFVQYYYKKIGSDKIESKTSYFRYIDGFHWIVATGVYQDAITKHTDYVVKKFSKQFKKYMYEYLTFFVFLAIIFSIFLFLALTKTKEILKGKDYALKEHAKILEVIVKIQQAIISNNNFSKNIETILKSILEALDVDRVYIFENSVVDGELCCSIKFECVKDGIKAQINNTYLQNTPYDKTMPRWKNILSNNEYIDGFVDEFPRNERKILEQQDILSVLVLPIFYADKWWGFIGFDDCTKHRKWTHIEKDSLQIVAASFVSALQKDMYYKNLRNRVKDQIKDIRKKDNMLIQQAKMASMGEMIGNIAHQWRQPLNVIGASLISLQLRYENDLLNDKYVQDYVNKLNRTIQNMSQTIDDFRNFFRPVKSKEEFSVKDIIEETIKLIGASFTVHNIKINIHRDKEHILYGYRNEFTQVVLVILNNSKDAIVQRGISDGNIDIEIYKDKDNIYIDICDNGGGVKPEIFSKLFEPYFTTKFKNQGTGIGLYMIKQILQKHMKGDIFMQNYNNGLKSTIVCTKLGGRGDK